MLIHVSSTPPNKAVMQTMMASAERKGYKVHPNAVDCNTHLIEATLSNAELYDMPDTDTCTEAMSIGLDTIARRIILDEAGYGRMLVHHGTEIDSETGKAYYFMCFVHNTHVSSLS